MTDPATQQKAFYVQDKDINDIRNEIGGSIGGPIIKDKLFFFTSITPEFRHRKADVATDNGNGPSSRFDSDNKYLSAFNKISWDPASRLRTNFTWLVHDPETGRHDPGFWRHYCRTRPPRLSPTWST